MKRGRVLEDVYKGHQGEEKCIRRAVQVVLWADVTLDICDLIRNSKQCEEFWRITREPLLSTLLPERPWQRLALDLFEKGEKTCMVVIDDYSRYIAIHEL